MKLLFLTIFVLTFGSVNSQTLFYVKPLAFTKINMGSTSQFVNSSITYSGSQNVVFENQRYILPMKLSPLSLGLSFGMLSSNQKNKYEVSFCSDGTNSGFKYFVQSYSFSTYQNKYVPTSNFVSINDGRSIPRIELKYERKIVSTPLMDINFTLNSGIWLTRQRDFQKFNEISSSYLIDTVGTVYTVTSYVYYVNQTKVFTHGCGLNFSFKTAKGKYLMDVFAQASFSTKSITVFRTESQINYPDGSENKIYNGFFSKGSGYYFGVSRRINLYREKQK
jgi:hypothetical protein